MGKALFGPISILIGMSYWQLCHLQNNHPDYTLQLRLLIVNCNCRHTSHLPSVVPQVNESEMQVAPYFHPYFQPFATKFIQDHGVSPISPPTCFYIFSTTRCSRRTNIISRYDPVQLIAFESVAVLLHL